MPLPLEALMTDALTLIVALSKVSSADSAWRLGTGYFASLGFARVNYGYTRFRHDRSVGFTDTASTTRAA